MSILFYSKVDAPQPWALSLGRDLPQLCFRVWPDVGAVDQIRYALVWKPQAGLLASLPRLRAILSLGAGVDHILADPQLPADVPIVRLVDAGLAAQMTEYGVYAVLHFHRSMNRYGTQQHQMSWRQWPAIAAARRTVGVLGLGVLGSDLATRLAALGFDVRGWTRTAKVLPGLQVFAGANRWHEFLAEAEILINLLPLTAHTAAILNAETFAALPRGACIINLARGEHLVEADLRAALDSGQLEGAMLDVFEHEPLPAGHPFWHHPKIVVTPHIAAQAVAELAVAQVVENIRRLERGEMPIGLVDRARGY